MRIIIPVLISLGLLTSCKPTNEKPNILWITAEDLSPYVGCYGDKNATTPSLDQLASEGTMYTNAYANASVCAPARATLITGMYASTTGSHNMRSTYKIPETIKSYAEILREHGYYCTNHSKKDYNSSMLTRKIWDRNGSKAHYNNREEGQPFFAVYNFLTTHESCIHNYKVEDLVHDPASVELPPYHPDLPEIRQDWARLYDCISKHDKEVGRVLKELEENGDLNPEAAGFMLGFNDAIPAEI